MASTKTFCPRSATASDEQDTHPPMPLVHLHRRGLQSAPWQQPQRPCSAAGGKPAQEEWAQTGATAPWRATVRDMEDVRITTSIRLQLHIGRLSSLLSNYAAGAEASELLSIWFNLGPESESFICATLDKSAFISLDQYNLRTDPLTYFTSVQSCSLIYNILCYPYFALSHFIVFPDNRELTVPHINSKHGCNKVTQGTQEMIN